MRGHSSSTEVHGRRNGRRPAKGSRGKRPAAAKPVERAATGAGVDVLALRKKIGKLYGDKPASRGFLAKLLRVSPGSVFNWERGTAPSTRLLDELRQLETQVEAGQLHVEAPRRGGRRRKGEGSPAGPASVASSRPATISGTVAAIYANVLAVEAGEHDVRIRLALRAPGGAEANAVADVILPRGLARELHAGLSGLAR